MGGAGVTCLLEQRDLAVHLLGMVAVLEHRAGRQLLDGRLHMSAAAPHQIAALSLLRDAK